MAKEKLLLSLPVGLTEKTRETLSEHFEEMGLLDDYISTFTALFYRDFIKNPMKYKARFAEDVEND